MPSDKPTLNNNIAYLKARRSGIEFALDKSKDELREYIVRVNKDIQEQELRLYEIVQTEEAARKEAKRRKAAAKKDAWK